MDIESLFSGMKEAPVFGRGSYITESGDFVVELDKILVKTSQKKLGETFFICEFKILESTSASNPVGASRSWTAKFSQRNTFGNIKELMFAVLGKVGKDVPETDKDSHELVTALSTAACSTDGGKDVPSAMATLKRLAGIESIEEVHAIVTGSKLLLRTVQTKTQAGGDYTRHIWAPVPAEGAESAA